MSGLAVLAVKEAAVASGLGTSVLPGIAPSAIDGFAVGTLLSALCILLVMAPRRRSRRSKVSGRDGVWTTAPHNPMTPDLSGYAATSAYSVAAAISNPFADESAEVVVSLPSWAENAQVPDLKNGGKHRSSGSEVPERRPEAKRSSGRHAAPPVGAGSRMASKLPLHQLATRD
jgi:hypothetical protein